MNSWFVAIVLGGTVLFLMLESWYLWKTLDEKWRVEQDLEFYNKYWLKQVEVLHQQILVLDENLSKTTRNLANCICEKKKIGDETNVGKARKVLESFKSKEKKEPVRKSVSLAEMEHSVYLGTGSARVFYGQNYDQKRWGDW